MKTTLLFRLFCIALALVSLSFIDPYAIKRVTDANFKYEFYTTGVNVKVKKGLQYYWFKGGAIHSAQSGISGELLNDKFSKLYLGNQLAEQGQFENGLKDGLWKTWYENGNLQSVENWKKGLRHGGCLLYDVNGTLLEKGNYKNNGKHRLWIDYQKKDTIVYRNGSVFIKKQKLTKEEKAALKAAKQQTSEINGREGTVETKKGNFFTRLFSKKQPSEPVVKENKKPNFFKRLFAKKEPKQKTNG